MKGKLIIASIVCVLMLSFLSSCQSREEKVINRLEKLSRNIEKNADGFTSEEWDGDESTISDYNTGNKVEIQEDTLEEDPINDNVEPEKYGARNNEELVDIQQ